MSSQDPSSEKPDPVIPGLSGYGQICRVRKPLVIAGGSGARDGKTTLVQEDDDAALKGGTLAINWISFLNTAGGSYTGNPRDIVITLCDASFDVDRSPFPPGQSVLFAGVVANMFQQFDNLPVPRDIGGAQFMALRTRIRAGAGNYELRVGLVELFGVSR